MAARRLYVVLIHCDYGASNGPNESEKNAQTFPSFSCMGQVADTVREVRARNNEEEEEWFAQKADCLR